MKQNVKSCHLNIICAIPSYFKPSFGSILNVFRIITIVVLLCSVCVDVESRSRRRRIRNVECGTIDPFVNSTEVKSPWTVPLGYRNDACLWEYLQSAVVISPTSVITSGSPLLLKLASAPNRIGVDIGKVNRSRVIEVRNIQPIISETNEAGSNFNSETWLYILHLEEPIPMSSSYHIRPICIDSKVFETLKLVLINVGFGANNDNRPDRPILRFSGFLKEQLTNMRNLHISPRQGWKVDRFDMNKIKILTSSVSVFGVNWQTKENTYVPRHFDPGSALTISVQGRWYLLGLLPMNSNKVPTKLISVQGTADYILKATRCNGLYTCPNSEGTCVDTLDFCNGNDQTRRSVCRPSSFEEKGFCDSFLENASFNSCASSSSMRQRQPPSPPRIAAKPELMYPRPSPPPRASSTPFDDDRIVGKLPSEIRCPSLHLSEGVHVRCRAKTEKQLLEIQDDNVSEISTSSNTLGDCTRDASEGTVAIMKCKPFYKPFTISYAEKTCDDSGRWTPRRTFECALDCGLFDKTKLGFIVNGQNTKSEKWPWHVVLYRSSRNGTFEYICGGTLISRSVVLTAAHCVADASGRSAPLNLFKIILGASSSRYSHNLNDDQAQFFNVANITAHPNYNNKEFEGDIAVMQLEKPVILSDYVRPVCWPYPSMENQLLERYQLSEGNYGTVIGYGLSEDWKISVDLREVRLPYVSVKECVRVLNNNPSNSQFCAGYTNGTSICEGDSGGGLFFQEDSKSRRFYIQGIVSYGSRDPASGHCDPYKYTVFTRVIMFNSWIKNMVDALDYDYLR